MEAKDINGYSDPYCMLGIQPAEVSCKLKPTPMDDGGIYCGDETEDSNSNTGETVQKITIASGSSISITIGSGSTKG